MPTINPQEIKKRSEAIILNAGGDILDWLPIIEEPQPRPLHAVVNRALILNAMYQLHMKAPKYYIADWLAQHSLTDELSPNEYAILYSPKELQPEDHYYLYYSLNSLWAIAWATNLIQELPFDQSIGKELASLSPNLQINEDGYKYESAMQLRSTESLYAMLDLYYRVHWWINNAHRENKDVGEIDIETIAARRTALEWILNQDSRWDNVDLSL